MKILFGILLVLCLLFSLGTLAALAGEGTPSVEITLPKKRVAIDDEFEMTVKLSNLDDTVDTLSIVAPGFEITDSCGNSTRSHLKIALSELSGNTETITLKWAATGSAMSSGVLGVSCFGEGVGKIEQTPDGGYEMVEGPNDHRCFALNERYIAFGEDETAAEVNLSATPIEWIVIPAVVGVAVVGVTAVGFMKIKSKKGGAKK